MLDPKTRRFYERALVELRNAEIPFLVGGAYALRYHTGIKRETKDLDLMVLPNDPLRAFAVLERAGFRTELKFPHWLGKVIQDDEFIDIIFNAGNGLAPVDESYFDHAENGSIFGIPIRWCPAEEMILSKSFVMERERYDGADVAHLIHARGHELDWTRLLARFGEQWRVLYAHVVLFGFIYPDETAKVPVEIVRELSARLQRETMIGSSEHVCRGTLLSREQFLVDIEDWGYDDARLTTGAMKPQEIERWTAAIDEPRAEGGHNDGTKAQATHLPIRGN